jgi:hypothetical protein
VFNDLQQYVWVAFLVTAIYLAKSGRGNWWLIGALIGFSIWPAVYSFARWEWLSYETIEEWTRYHSLVQVVSVGLLIIGLVKLARHGPVGATVPRTLRPLDSGAVSLATLFIPRNNTNTYSRAEPLRDQACARLTALAKSAGMEVIEQKSNLHSPEVWFRLDYVIPQPQKDLSLRAYVHVTIERFDYHRFEHLYSITAQAGADAAHVNGVIDIDDNVATRIHNFITRPGARLRIPYRIRHYGWQLWLPRNKISRLGIDLQAAGIVVGGVILAVLCLAAPDLLELERDSSFQLLRPMSFVALIATAVVLGSHNRRKRTYVLTTGKPPAEPRVLQWLDSWQANVSGLGPHGVKTAQAIIDRIRAGGPKDLFVRVERVGYWGVDSRVTRDQICIRFRRALAFIHVVPYSDALYLAWECHLNAAVWTEQTLAVGFDCVSKKKVHANRIVASVQMLNEYDIADSNFLAELIHESMKLEIKLKLAELKIDQEIDFTVQRESRKGALESEPAEEKTKPKKRLFQRIG